MTPAELVAPHIANIQPYKPGKPIEELERELGITGALKVASNENPAGPSPLALQAMANAATTMHAYPDGGCFALRSKLCAQLGIEPNQVIFGAGSNEIIYLIINTFCRPGIDEILTHKYAFITYRLAALTHNVSFVEADVTDDLACDVDALIELIGPNTRIVFLANPNNPTGAYVPRLGFERLLGALPAHTILVVDEAYHEYATTTPDYPQSQHYQQSGAPHVITLRTFSKIYGLAGLRIGYAIGSASHIGFIERIRRPFNANSLAQAAAFAALDDTAHIENSRNLASTALRDMGDRLGEHNIRTYPSLGNFLLVDVGRPSDTIYHALLAAGVIVRPMGAWGLPTHLRVSAGRAEHSARIAQAIVDAVANAQ